MYEFVIVIFHLNMILQDWELYFMSVTKVDARSPRDNMGKA